MIRTYHNTAMRLGAFYDAIQERAASISQPLGNGCFAFVYPHRTDPNAVVKVAQNRGMFGVRAAEAATMDGCLRYLSLIEQHRTRSAFFPRVHRVEIFTNEDHPDDGVVFAVTMEKLTPWRRVRGMTEKSFARMISSRLDCVTGLAFSIGAVRADALKNGNVDAVALVDVLESLWSTNGNDLHNNNWMARPTAQGYVPVITDPAV